MSNPMNIVVPVPGTTPGPEWAEDINNILENIVANHNHQPAANGGVQLTQDALNITNTLSLQNQALSAVNEVRLQNKGSISANTNTLSDVNGNLWFKDTNGVGIQITANGQLNANATGGITGLASSDGRAIYTTGLFSWKKTNGNQYANMGVGGLSVYGTSQTNPSFAVNITQPATLIANKTLTLSPQNITLPQTLPASTGSILMTPSGVMTASVPNATSNNIASTTWAVSPGTSLLTTTYTPTGRRVIFTITNIAGGAGYLRFINTSAFFDTYMEAQLNLYIAGSPVSTLQYRQIFSYATNAEIYTQPSLTYIWTPTDAQVGTAVSIELKGFDISNLAGRTCNSSNLRLQITDL